MPNPPPPLVRAGKYRPWKAGCVVSSWIAVARLALPALGFLGASCTPQRSAQQRAVKSARRPHLGQHDRFFKTGTQTAQHAWFRQAEPDAVLGTAAEQSTLDEVLTFLVSAVVIAPLSRQLKLSPTLGFLIAGALLGPAGFGVFADDESIKRLADIGILFLLFEQGLELSSERLKQLSVYAFGLGSLQVLCTGLIIAGIAYLGGAVALEPLALPDIQLDLLASVKRLDQITVIAASLALSSSAFVLKVLEENKLGNTTVGQASLGVLLFQDIAVVPLLVILPLIEDTSGGSLDGNTLACYVVTAFLGLAVIGLFGRFVLRTLFDAVAATRSPSTFVSLCVLCVLGTSQLTEYLGLSTSLGAFLAGTLLAESNYRTQVEADIAPFKGLLLGLFFLTTGAQVDPTLLVQEWELSLALLLGLSVLKAVVVAALSPVFGLTLAESAQLGCVLAGGGEFAFVIFTLSGTFNILPGPIIKILTGVVVISMALTPVFSLVGQRIAESFTPEEEVNLDAEAELEMQQSTSQPNERLALICGMGPIGQQVASFLLHLEAAGGGLQWIGLDLDQYRVNALRSIGQPVFYGDASKLSVLTAAGVVAPPKVIVVTYPDQDERRLAIERLRYSFPHVPIISHAGTPSAYSELRRAGAGPSSEGDENEGIRSDQTVEGGISVFSSVVETARRLGRAAIQELGDDVPSDIQEEWFSQVRKTTEDRLVIGSTQDSMVQGDSRNDVGSPDVKAQEEASTFVVIPEPDVELVDSYESVVWDAPSKASTSSTIKALRYLESLSMLQSLSKDEVQKLQEPSTSKATGTCPALTWRKYVAGEVLVSHSDTCKEMFVVECGECVATLAIGEGTVGDQNVVAKYTSGGCFNELAMFLDRPSAVKVTALTDVQVMVVDRPTFQCLVRTGRLGLESLQAATK